MNLEETGVHSETLYDGSFLRICRDRVRLPDGKEAERMVVRHPGAACVLAETETGQIILVKQWRYAAGRALLEVPAGKLAAGEDPALCALRELAEETPYTAGRVEKIAEFYTAPGFCDEVMHVYRAHGVKTGSTLAPDEDEFVQTVLMNRDETRAALQNGEICDAKTVVAVQIWLGGVR